MRKMILSCLALFTILTLCTLPASAATVDVEASGGAVTFMSENMGAGILTVTGPNDFRYRAPFTVGEMPVFAIVDGAGDGRYKWEIDFASTGRASGRFIVRDGAPVRTGALERP